MRIANRPALSRTAHALVLSAAASLALLLMLVAGSDSIVRAQTPDTPTPEATQGPGDWGGVENLPPIEGKRSPPKYPNMDSNLNRIVQRVETGQSTARAAASNAPLSSDESVAVTIYVTEGFAAAIVVFLESNGASPRNVGTDYVEAYVPVSLLPDTSAQEGVISVRTIIPPRPAQSTASSEAATAHGATAWHSAGLKGQGVRIGIIDLGFSGFRGLMGSELPSSVEARCYIDVDIFTANLTDCEAEDDPHGTAVTEAAFDIAPEATYYIASPISRGDLANVVSWMIDRDVDIINHSLNWIWSGPGDGTSHYNDSTLKTVDAAIVAGITWVNSAGNSATETWFGNFNDPDGSGIHVFPDDASCNALYVGEGNLHLDAILRWDDTWQGSTEDLDLVLFEVSPFTGAVRAVPPILTGGDSFQDGDASDIPFERVSYSVLSPRVLCLAVFNFSETSPGWLQLQIWSGQDLFHHTLHHSITEPADSANPGLLAVGATDIRNTFTIEEFSSKGPTNDGRIKPDVVGADKVHSVAYGESFPGTSQASPHVAGLAALVKQRFPDYAPQQVANYLKTHAGARGSVPNSTWGYGFAKLVASDAATPTPEPTPEPTTTSEPTVTPEPTPEPPADSCVETLSADGTVSGSWDSDCASESRVGSYARFYTFTLDEPRDVAITLESEVDTYLYAREGEGTDGRIVYEDDDDDNSAFSLASSTDSGISESLGAGVYTIEATTVTAGETGEFTLTIRGVTGAYDALFDRYDTDGDGQINKPEVIAAVRDYLGGQITKAQVVEVIRHYIIGPPTPAPPVDRAALVALYNATDGPNWTNNHNWLSEAPIGEWYGVTTDDDGRVTQIRLWENNLIGSIPADLGNLTSLQRLGLWSNDLSGEIPSELGNLSSLERMSLDDNQLSGGIPSELGSLSNLERIFLHGNQLSGEIPSELGNLSSPERMSLDDNQLSGGIPSELGNLSNLERLYLTRNQLSGEIPTELSSLLNLEELALGGNQLSGSIPAELGSLASLIELYLWGNEFSGDIPSELGSLSSLTVLHLGGNQLSGEIPAELGNLASLVVIGLDENQLSGEIPEELGNLSNLSELYLYENQLSGEIPSELGRLANLTVLNAWNNQLSGELPSELGNLSNLTLLDLPENQFSGEIPSELGNLSNLTVLGLWGNQLSGEIPSELGSLANLTRLYLNNNDLSGEIPSELGDLDNLQRLDLGDNELSGEIPSELGSLSNLERISLNENELSGEIPSELGSLSSLERMSLNYNELSGEIPSELGSLSNLERISLNENELSGEIPSELGGLSDLTELYLWGNQLSGEIPSELGDLMNLTTLELAQNQLSGEIPSELGNLSNLTLLNLTRNEVRGSIPDELGRLNSLEILALGGNQLNGEIPAELGNLSNLAELWAWSNQLSGEIPAELGNLSSLRQLSLDGNQLTGEIPAQLGSLSEMVILSISRNRLSGEIPSELGRLDNLDQLYLYNNQLSGDIPSELLAKSGLRIMALYGNQLSGDVPEHTEERAILTTLYNSTSGTEWKENENWGSAEPVFTWNRVLIDTSGRVTALWLHENQLSGEIPSELGSLTNLARLFLFDNQLTGEIPSELSNLEDLEHLFIAGNQLSGCIPVGLQDVPENDFGDLDLEFCSDEN